MADLRLEPATRRLQAERKTIPALPGFGSNLGDHAVLTDWNPERGWHGHRIVGCAPFTLDPASTVFHYAQETLEGLRTYAREDGSIWRFRVDVNAAQSQRSARRPALPELNIDDFLTGVDRLMEVDRDWVLCRTEQNLYLKPFMFAHSAFPAIKPSTSVTYAVVASPSGAYFGGSGVQPVKIWVSRDFSRVAPGGTDFAKRGGDYAASMVAQQEAEVTGCSQVVSLGAVEHHYVGGLDGINLLAATTDGHVITPVLTDSILEGATHSAVLHFVADAGLTVEERRLPQQEPHRGIGDGNVREVFACGTAAIIIPVASFTDPDGIHTVADGQPGATTLDLCRQLTEIQYGRRPDPYGWIYRIV